MAEKHITIGIAGHVDHGKTSLVKALTGIDTDRLQEEKRRGLSIESGIAPMNLLSGESIALVDVPGHTDFMKNTIRGLSSVDAAVLVVASDDGVMPQTREHIEILRCFGAKTGFVVLSKADLVDEETLEMAELEIRELLEGSFLQERPILRFSALGRSGLEEVRIELEKVAEICPGKNAQSPFRLWVDHLRGIPGFGTVASGTVLSGHLREDDPLVLQPSGRETRARSLESHHRKVSEAFAGQRVGINLHKVQLHDVARGMLISKPGLVTPCRYLNVDIRVLTGAKKPLKNRQRVKLHLGTSLTNAMVVLMGKESLKPGEKTLAQLRTTHPVPAQPADPFVISLLDVPTIVGGGRVLETASEKYREAKFKTTSPYLQALQDQNLTEALSWFFKKNPSRPALVEEITRATGFSLKQVDCETRNMLARRELISLRGCGLVVRASYEKLKSTLLQTIRAMLEENALKEAVNAEEAKAQALPAADHRLVQQMLDDLCRTGTLRKVGAGYRATDVAANLSREQEELVGLLLDYAAKSGLSPFCAETIWRLHKKEYEKKLIQRHLDFLKSRGKLVLLGDRRFLSVDALEEIKKRVGNVIARKGSFTIPDCRESFGYGRTVAIPVLEYLDTIAFTRRQGDARYLMREYGPARTDPQE